MQYICDYCHSEFRPTSHSSLSATPPTAAGAPTSAGASLQGPPEGMDELHHPLERTHSALRLLVIVVVESLPRHVSQKTLSVEPVVPQRGDSVCTYLVLGGPVFKGLRR